jgi:hypothetical protein
VHRNSVRLVSQENEDASPQATLVRLRSNAGHAVAADASPQLSELRDAISEFLLDR